MTAAPAVLFTYTRPLHTRATVDALRANLGAEDTVLHIYSDGPKNPEQAAAVADVRSYLKTVSGFASVVVIERERNMGLANSVITGVSEMLGQYPSVIVMEDDMVTSRTFLNFMNAALKIYSGRKDIFTVSGYSYPISIPNDYPEEAYLSYRSSSWGWGTWSDRWEKVDWEVRDFSEFLSNPVAVSRFERGGSDLLPMLEQQLAGRLDSWAIRFNYAHAKHDAVCLHPVRSKLRNIGFDGTGVHGGVSAEYDVEIDEAERDIQLKPDLQLDPQILDIFNERFQRPHTSGALPPKTLPKRILARLRRRLLGY